MLEGLGEGFWNRVESDLVSRETSLQQGGSTGGLLNRWRDIEGCYVASCLAVSQTEGTESHPRRQF